MTRLGFSVVMWMSACAVLVDCFSSGQGKLSAGKSSGIGTSRQNKVLNMFLKTPELVRKYGYPIEEHTVVTEDGYLLIVHRIPGSPKRASGGVATPVLLQHGILAASDFWVTTEPQKALGFLLADRGYDVWISNSRGNVYSRSHKTISPKNPKFWDFSWHEMGVYDLPAVIDYILKVTGQQKLLYVGHSMGTTMFFVMASTRPEYNQKIRLMVALAPVAFNSAIVLRNFPAKLGLPYADVIYRGFVNAGQQEMLSRIRPVGLLLDELCRDGSKTQFLCQLVYYGVYGNDGSLLNTTMLPEFFYRVQAGTSLKTVYHYVQNIHTGRFQLLDRSGRVNGIMPNYNLTKITAPVSLHYAQNDIWSAREGVAPLAARLRNVVKVVRLPDDRINHNDYGFAIDAKRLIYDEILELLAAH